MKSLITKTLSANDTGETGGHQAGILVPKTTDILSYFPKLDEGIKNPRCDLKVTDANGEVWTFRFIYYNNRFFGGTRNEFRITGMTDFIRRHNLKAGDELRFLRTGPKAYFVSSSRRRAVSAHDQVLVLGKTWKLIHI